MRNAKNNLLHILVAAAACWQPTAAAAMPEATGRDNMKPWRADLPIDLALEAVTGDAQLEAGSERGPHGGSTVRWNLPPQANSSKLVFDLNALGILPNDFDELHIEFKTAQSLVLFMPRLNAYPVNDLCRSWYSKIEMQPSSWITARFDLRLDDDGWAMGHKPMESPQLVVTAAKRWMRTPGESQHRTITLGRISLVRNPVTIDFEPTDATLRRDTEALAWTYVLHMQNKTLDTVRGTLDLETNDLSLFTPDWTAKQLTFTPREQKDVALTLTAQKTAATARPPLYSERTQAFFHPPSENQPAVTPLHGYRPKFIWATVPPDTGAWTPKRPPPEQAERIIKRARTALTERWGVPIHGPAGHPQSYIDKASNQPPKALSWFRHVAPDNTPIENPDVAKAYVGLIHSGNFQRANLLGKAFQLTGNVEYAAAARDVFLEYCHWYPYLPVSSPASTSGLTRLHQSSLQTCFWFAAAIDAYARIRLSAALGDADREQIETRFFKPELSAIYAHNVEFSNMQVHHYETTTHGAVALDRFWNLVGDALYGTHGFYSMIEHTFTEDGLSHEAGVYHWFTLAPMMEFVEKMDAFGLDVMNQRFKRVFDGTLENTPNGIVAMKALARFYPRAYQAYRDPRYIPTLKRIDAWPPPWMDPDDAAREKAPNTIPLTGNTNQANNGYLWLRETSKRGFRALSINYVMQLDRGEHDRLHVALFDPDRLTSEIYRITYGSPDAKMMVRTFGHNTVVIDRGNQRDLPSRLAAFLDRPSLPAALITEQTDSNIWPGAAFARCVAILDGVFFVGDLYHQAGEHTFDWPVYAPWEPWVEADVGMFHPEPAAIEPVDLGYPFVTDSRGVITECGISAYVHVPKIKPGSGRAESRAKPYKTLFLTAAAQPHTLVATARVPRGHRPKPGPMMLLRQAKTDTACFGVAFDVAPVGGKSCVKSVKALPVNTTAGKAADRTRTAAWSLTTDSDSYLVVINRTGEAVAVDGISTSERFLVTKRGQYPQGSDR